MDNYDVILCVALGGDLVRSTEHLGISYIASYLRERGVKVCILEIVDETDIENIAIIENSKVKLIGFTVTVKNVVPALKIARSIKSHGKVKAHITAGGHMASFAGDAMLKTGVFDSVAIGEGEITIYQLWESLVYNTNWKKVNGLAYMEGKKIVYNEKRDEILDLDKLPFPARDQFEKHKKDMQYLRICSSRGCYGTCAFCSAHSFYDDPQWRGRSPENTVEEIRTLVDNYGIHTFDFTDSTFEDPPLIGKKRIGEIAQLLIDKEINIYYNCCFRAESWSEQDIPLLTLLSKSGLEKVNIGFEGGNPKCLNLLNKIATTADNDRVIKLLRNFPEIYLTFGFLTFHPMITAEDLRDNVDFLFNTGIGQVSRHYFWKLEIYPGTKILADTKAAGLIKGEYDPINGMYNYDFFDKKVGVIDSQCRKFLDLKSVWDYEIFDIVMHTFIWRPLRLYPKHEALLSLLAYVNESRKKIAKYNHELMYRIIDGITSNQLENEVTKLDKLLLTEMDLLESKKLQCGMKLIKEGINLPKR